MSNPTTLQTATQDRKARLAQLKSLQRKNVAHDGAVFEDKPTPLKRKSPSRSPSPDVTKSYLSGRNYDTEVKGPKLGYEAQPGTGKTTLETQAKTLVEQSKAEQQEEATQADQTVDLFKLQPKKPTWDLKRHLNKKLEVLNARTDNAIARLVRDRVQQAQEEAKANSNTSHDREKPEDGNAIGIEGAALVEATREMEREEGIEEQLDESEALDENDSG